MIWNCDTVDSFLGHIPETEVGLGQIEGYLRHAEGLTDDERAQINARSYEIRRKLGKR